MQALLSRVPSPGHVIDEKARQQSILHGNINFLRSALARRSFALNSFLL